MKVDKTLYDFSGYVTRYNVLCSDGRTIAPDSFKHLDGQTVPLLYQHGHQNIDNVLGNVYLEHRQDGMYGYARLNKSRSGESAKELVDNGDIKAFSIHANQLVQNGKIVQHGQIREVSLVIAGANPEAQIDNVSFRHSDGEIVEFDDEAFIITSFLEHDSGEEDEDEDTSERTIQDILDTMNDEQLGVVVAIAADAAGTSSDEDEEGEPEDTEEVEHSGSGEGKMKKTKNIFEMQGSAIAQKQDEIRHSLTEAGYPGYSAMMQAAIDQGTLKSFKDVLTHAAAEYGIENIEYLFPEAKLVSNEPTMISREMDWVNGVIDSVRKSPFARIKSLHADITADEARAKGYTKGNRKMEEVFTLLKRETYPTTVYKKQKLDRDDILDIVDFDVVNFMKAEMRLMLLEEMARQILIGDGRKFGDEDRIDPSKIRPIYEDDEFYTLRHILPKEITPTELEDSVVVAQEKLKGTGTPTMYTTKAFRNKLLLSRDSQGRKLYETEASLASSLGVAKIVCVEPMEGLFRTDASGEGAPKKLNCLAILVNLRDYVLGANPKGEVAYFEDFDIDFNQYKYLYETRKCGALDIPFSALVLEQEA